MRRQALKNIFADTAFSESLRTKGIELSSANSINFGRLAPQIVYYVYAYLRLLQNAGLKEGEKLNFVVPTGNFGNILAAYYAKRMGVPIGKLICASNKNNVLTDFFHKGHYNANREFFKTSSPSMDILVSSNLERLLFELSGRNAECVKKWMSALMECGEYGVSIEDFDFSDFYADWADETETFAAIKRTFEEEKYLIDTHTAVAVAVYDKYVNATGDKTETVIVSTANPYKFAADVLSVFEQPPADAFAAVGRLNELTGAPIPCGIIELKSKKERHLASVQKNNMKEAIESFLR